MKVVLCVVAAKENLYINEWCHHYLNIGFDHIYIYNNDNPEDEYIGNAIGDDIKDKITIMPGYEGEQKINLQCSIYNVFYGNHKNEFDWCAFFDVDEFLDGISDIKEFLNQDKFDNYNQIFVKWRLFGDDDLIERDVTQPVYGFFKQVQENPEYLSNQIKIIARGGLEQLRFINVHFASELLGVEDHYVISKGCFPSGKEATITYYCISDKKDYDNETIYLNHYRTKTLSEFMHQKLPRGDRIYSFYNIKMKYYWEQNKHTPEKDKYVQEHKDLLEIKPIKIKKRSHRKNDKGEIEWID